MTFVWNGKEEPDAAVLSGRKWWRYYYYSDILVNSKPKQLKPQAGVFELEDKYWMFYRLNKDGTRAQKGTRLIYFASFSDDYEEAVANYNGFVEDTARKFEEMAENIRKEKVE